MEILSHIEGFEWDGVNIEKNRIKHGVTHIECEEVFFNRPIVVKRDDPHSKLEGRFFALGRTDSERLLFLVFTIRGKKIRVISARDMNKEERKIYEHIEKNTRV